jgi:hypothetical protein
MKHPGSFPVFEHLAMNDVSTIQGGGGVRILAMVSPLIIQSQLDQGLFEAGGS